VPTRWTAGTPRGARSDVALTRPTLVTQRLRLEPLTAEHGELLAGLDSDPEVMRFITGRARSREEVLRDWLPLMMEEMGADGLLGYWVGFRRTEWAQTPSRGADFLAIGTNRKVPFVGWWCLTPSPEDPGSGELGYRLRREHWGLGLATEGARALLDHGFETVGLDRIWAQTMAVNTASRAVMGRIGMQYVRTWVGEWNEPLAGWEDGEVEYALTREAWGAGIPPPQD
jgi:RimJ/RimL family protein N-acetyltransferase